jgi:hypothetical protein
MIKFSPGWRELGYKRFDIGNCNCYGLITPKSKRKGRQDRRKALPTELIRLAGKKKNNKIKTGA